MKRTLLFALTAGLFFSACKKDDDNSTPQSRIVGKWIITADRTTITFNNASAPTDNYANRLDCENDDLYVFNSDNSLARERGATPCRSTDPVSETLGTWTLFSNDTRLRLVADTFDVIQLTSSDMKLRRYIASGSGSRTDTVTYSKR